MSLQNDTATTTVNINTNQARAEMLELEKSIAKAREELKLMAKTDAGYKEKRAEVKALSDQHKELKKQFENRIDLVINGQAADVTMKELRMAARQLDAELKNLSVSSTEFSVKSEQLRNVNTRISELNASLKPTQSLFSTIKDELKAFGVLAISYLGFQEITGQINNIVNRNAKLSDSLADIRRVAGLTEIEVRALNAELSSMNTRTSTDGLREIAIIAGKLGVAKGDIAGFTREVDKLVVTLGDELGNADQVTTNLGKILNVYDGKISAENISTLGNAIVKLANDGVATGGFISDFTQRVSGIATSANLSLPATLGLAAGFEELGQRSESSSTALQKLIVHIGQDVPAAARLAGAKTKEEIDQFVKDFAERPQEALIKFAEGLTKNKSSFQEVAAAFKDAGEDGKAVIGVLTQMGQKGDFLREKITAAGEAIKSTDQINQAFALKNETFGANLEKLGKRLNQLFVTNGISDAFKGIVKSLLDLTEPTDNFLEKSAAIIESNRQQATSAQRLMDEYSLLTREGIKPTAQEKERLKIVTLQLRDALGDSVVQIDKETGAMTLNVEKAKDMIKQKILLANSEASTLALKADNLKQDADGQQKSIDQLREEIRLRKEILESLGMNAKEADNMYSIYLEGGNKAKAVEADLGKEKLNAVFNYERGLNSLNKATGALKETEEKRAEILGKLKELGFKEADVQQLFNTATAANQQVKSESIDTINAVDEAAKKLDKLREKLRDLAHDLAENEKGQYAQEVDAIKDKYAKLREEAAGDKQSIAKINELERTELAQKEEQLNDVVNGIRENLLESRKDRNQRELDEIAKKYDAEIEKFKGFTEKQAEIEAMRDAALNDKRKEQAVKEAEDRAAVQDKIFETLQSSDDREVSAAADKWDKLIMQADKYGLDATALYKAKQTEIELLTAKHQKKELDATKKHNAELIAADKKRFAAARSLLSDYGTFMSSLLTIMGADASAHGTFSKELALAQIAINEAEAISSLIKMSQANPANSVTSGAAGAAQFLAGMAQITAGIANALNIINGKEVPSYGGSGAGKVESGSGDVPQAASGALILQGPSHNDGGIGLYDRSGRKILEAEGGEPAMILSKNTMANNGDLIRRLLDSSLNRNGAPVMSAGGLVEFGRNVSASVPSFFNTPLSSFSTTGMTQAVRESKIEVKVTTETPQFDTSLDARSLVNKQLQQMEQMVQVVDRMAAAVGQLNTHLSNPKPVPAQLNYQNFMIDLDRLQTIKSEVTMKA